MLLSRWLKPGPAWPKPGQGPNFGNLGTWISRNLESNKIPKTKIKNPNPCRPKCRQGLDWPEKDLPGPIGGHPRPFVHNHIVHCLFASCCQRPYYARSPQLPISPPRVDSSKGPNRVNRAHWPTKGNRRTKTLFFFLSVHGKNAWDATKWGQEDFCSY